MDPEDVAKQDFQKTYKIKAIDNNPYYDSQLNKVMKQKNYFENEKLANKVIKKPLKFGEFKSPKAFRSQK
jgi:hypothetical protein